LAIHFNNVVVFVCFPIVQGDLMDLYYIFYEINQKQIFKTKYV
jgi:hypothetical protein